MIRQNLAPLPLDKSENLCYALSMGHFDGLTADEVLDTLENLLTELQELSNSISMHRIKLKLTENERRAVIFKLFDAPELVSQAEIARRTSLSRQRISQLLREYTIETELGAELERINRLKQQ